MKYKSKEKNNTNGLDNERLSRLANKLGIVPTFITIKELGNVKYTLDDFILVHNFCEISKEASISESFY